MMDMANSYRLPAVELEVTTGRALRKAGVTVAQVVEDDEEFRRVVRHAQVLREGGILSTDETFYLISDMVGSAVEFAFATIGKAPPVDISLMTDAQAVAAIDGFVADLFIELNEPDMARLHQQDRRSFERHAAAGREGLYPKQRGRAAA